MRESRLNAGLSRPAVLDPRERTRLQARTLVALADAAERDGRPDPRRLLQRAHRLYRDVSMPAAEVVAERLIALTPAEST